KGGSSGPVTKLGGPARKSRLEKIRPRSYPLSTRFAGGEGWGEGGRFGPGDQARRTGPQVPRRLSCLRKTPGRESGLRASMGSGLRFSELMSRRGEVDLASSLRKREPPTPSAASSQKKGRPEGRPFEDDVKLLRT